MSLTISCHGIPFIASHLYIDCKLTSTENKQSPLQKTNKHLYVNKQSPLRKQTITSTENKQAPLRKQTSTST